MVKGAAAAGAKGAAIGRNIFQAERPTELTRQIREILDSYLDG